MFFGCIVSLWNHTAEVFHVLMNAKSSWRHTSGLFSWRNKWHIIGFLTLFENRQEKLYRDGNRTRVEIIFPVFIQKLLLLNCFSQDNDRPLEHFKCQHEFYMYDNKWIRHWKRKIFKSKIFDKSPVSVARSTRSDDVYQKMFSWEEQVVIIMFIMTYERLSRGVQMNQTVISMVPLAYLLTSVFRTHADMHLMPFL